MLLFWQIGIFMLIKDSNDLQLNLEDLPVSDFWTENNQKPLKMHKIHWYPAKFPPSLVSKAFDYAKTKNVKINNVVDFFCGCGTTPLESVRHGYNFWGCDINPVATLIASVKSHKYNSLKLEKYYNLIIEIFNNSKNKEIKIDNERLQYWFPQKQLRELKILLLSIKKEVPKGVYRDFFLCAYSNILRGCSRWLTKSIKPQIDPNKDIKDVYHTSKDYPTSPYDIEYIENWIKKYLEVKSTSWTRKIFNMSSWEIKFMEKYAKDYLLILVTDVKNEFPHTDKYQCDDILLMKKEYPSTRFYAN